jgi:hypothetical protein
MVRAESPAPLCRSSTRQTRMPQVPIWRPFSKLDLRVTEGQVLLFDFSPRSILRLFVSCLPAAVHAALVRDHRLLDRTWNDPAQGFEQSTHESMHQLGFPLMNWSLVATVPQEFFTR